MTSPIQYQHPIGSSLQRYTSVPAALPDPGAPVDPPPPAGGAAGSVSLSGRAVGGGGTKITTIFGYNWNGRDNAEQTIAGRMAKFGNRAPCTRVYGTGGLTASFPVTTTTAPEKRVCYSFKAGGGFTATQLASTSTAAGSARATMKAFLQDIPANWTVYWVYHHEPNSSGGLEVPVADFTGAYDSMMWAKANATLQSGVQVFVTSNFMAYQVGTANWSNTWVPSCDILTWDMYGNPGQNTSSTGKNKYGTATGSAYGSTYPLIADRTAAMFKVTQDTGFAASWGILEVNTPLRNWDWGTTTAAKEAGRAAWHQDCIDYFVAGGGMTGGKPPKICLLWEAPSGVNWNQSYGYNGPQGTIAKSQSNVDSSPLWDVWYPYITGTPRGA